LLPSFQSPSSYQRAARKHTILAASYDGSGKTSLEHGRTLRASVLLCERKEGGRTALLTRTIERNASQRLRLSHARRLADKRSENRIPNWNGWPFVVPHGNNGWAVRALLGRRTEPRSASRQIAAIRRTRHTMMLPIATTARRQARRFSRTQREQRRDNRKAKDDQQQDGKQLTQ
jgi:hypothetical protein